MRLNQVEMDVAVSAAADRPGWYACRANLDRAPVVHLTRDGGMSIDTGDLDFDDVKLQIDLARDKHASLSFADARPSTLNVKARDVVIQDMLRPVVGALADDMAIDQHKDVGNDRGEMDVTVAHDRVTIEKALIQSKRIAAYGKGDVHFDGRIDMKVNAGVIEKAEALIGDLGDLFAIVTDRLLPYDISGTWSKPIVTPEPLGLPFGESRHKKK